MTESPQERMDRLERALTIQMQMLGRLNVAVTGHHRILEAWSQAAGIEPEPAQPARPSN